METLMMTTPEKRYPVHIGRGLLGMLKTHIDVPTETVLITDTNIPHAVIETVKEALGADLLITLEAGEHSKSLPVYADIVQRMLTAGLSRSTTVIAVGGGVVGDIAGFVAATYQRGIPWINIPTSLLAMVDASVGGKTAVNLDKYKNMLGAFHHPEAVIIDPDVLDTLPQRHMHNGYAEVIKAALIHDHTLYTMLKEDTRSLDAHIVRAIKVKQYYVEADPKDGHLRHMLNFGHTLGHAFETLYTPTYLHGECIAAGMRLMVRGTDLEAPVYALLDQYGLTAVPPIDKTAMVHVLRADKKRRGDQLTVVRLKAIGQGELIKMPFEAFIKILEKEDDHHV